MPRLAGVTSERIEEVAGLIRRGEPKPAGFSSDKP
jgi:hypothetical protein